MYGGIKNYMLIIIAFLFVSCTKEEMPKEIELVLYNGYFGLRERANIPPNNRIVGKIISYSNDTLYFNSMCSNCPRRGDTKSFLYVIHNADTIKLGNYYTPKLVIPPLDTLDYEVSFMFMQHATNKALERPDSNFWFQYDSTFLKNIIENKIYFLPSLKDYPSDEKIPNIVFRKDEHFKIHLQDFREYEFINQH